MATEAVLSVINEFEFFSQDPTLTNRVQKEKGINPATWNAIVKRIEEQGGSNDQIMNILKHAVQTVPPPSPRYPESFKSEYGIMWIKVAAQLRTQPQAQAMLAEWKNLKTFKHNAYFYSSWAYFEKSRSVFSSALLCFSSNADPNRRRYDDALGVLELGRSLNAEPQHLLEPLKASILTLQYIFLLSSLSHRSEREAEPGWYSAKYASGYSDQTCHEGACHDQQRKRQLYQPKDSFRVWQERW